MTRHNRRQTSRIQTTLQDYLVPIIAGFIIIIIIYGFFHKGDEPTTSLNTENKIPTTLSFGSTLTEAYIVYPGDTKEKALNGGFLYKGEKISVKEGTVKLETPEKNTINLNKIAEFKYNEDGSYTLYSSDAWISLKTPNTISLQYASVESPANSVLSLSQNEAGSTIYVLSGSAKVTNLGKVSTSLVKGQKISISRLNAASTDIDLASEKGMIDSYFKGSDWFIENEGHLVLDQGENLTTNSGSEVLGSTNSGTTIKGIYISFDTLRDEMSVENSSINISGAIQSDEVDSITLNNRQVTLNKAAKTFALQGLLLPNPLNDIVVKIYDTNKNIIEKKVYTVYTSQVSQNNTTTNTLNESNSTVSSTNSQGNTTYTADATKFGFTEPSNTGKFSTSNSEITIRGFTSAKGITAVQVNGFDLASFNGNTWRYHAFERFETLEEGTNQYKVDYFGEGGKLVYTDYYTIVKKATTSTVAPQTNTTNSSTSSTTSQETTSPQNSGSTEETLFSN